MKKRTFIPLVGLFLYGITASSLCFAVPDTPDSSSILNDYGLDLTIDASYLHLANPGMGQVTGMKENVLILSAGFDWDLEKSLSLDGTSIHFNQAYIPYIHNMTYGTQIGDSISGDPSPYIPRSVHLQKFTLQKNFMDDLLEIELGKSSSGTYFADMLCNLPYGCKSPLLPFDPGIYPTWGGRMKLNISSSYSSQFGLWNRVATYPLNNGWEWNENATSQTMFYNIKYHNDDQSSFLSEVELMVYNDNAQQINPSNAESHRGTTGLYLGVRSNLRKSEIINNSFSIPRVDIYNQLSYSFDSSNSTGLKLTNAIGINIGSFINSRPKDSYGLSFKLYELTDTEQRFINESFERNDSKYSASKSQKLVQADANIFLTDNFIVSPYIQYSWDVNNRKSYDFVTIPNDGIAFGILGYIKIDGILGI